MADTEGRTPHPDPAIAAAVASAVTELFGPCVDPDDLVEETPSHDPTGSVVSHEFTRTHAWFG